MPFKPRIIRFDDEQPGIPAPVGAGMSTPLGGSLAGLSDDRSNVIETPPHDPTHDTIRGAEFDTICDWNPDDAVLDDPKLQCLARQLSDDAKQLAKRYPAEGWVASSFDEVDGAVPRSTVVRPNPWRGIVAIVAALAACLTITLGPRTIGDGKAHDAGRPFPEINLTADLNNVTPSSSHVTYQNGDAAVWGENPVDASQFGNAQFGGLQFSDHEVTDGGSFDALRDLLPADSHEYCDVSM